LWKKGKNKGKKNLSGKRDKRENISQKEEAKKKNGASSSGPPREQPRKERERENGLTGSTWVLGGSFKPGKVGKKKRTAWKKRTAETGECDVRKERRNGEPKVQKKKRVEEETGKWPPGGSERGLGFKSQMAPHRNKAVDDRSGTRPSKTSAQKRKRTKGWSRVRNSEPKKDWMFRSEPKRGGETEEGPGCNGKKSRTPKIGREKWEKEGKFPASSCLAERKKKKVATGETWLGKTPCR